MNWSLNIQAEHEVLEDANISLTHGLLMESPSQINRKKIKPRLTAKQSVYFFFKKIQHEYCVLILAWVQNFEKFLIRHRGLLVHTANTAFTYVLWHTISMIRCDNSSGDYFASLRLNLTVIFMKLSNSPHLPYQQNEFFFSRIHQIQGFYFDSCYYKVP